MNISYDKENRLFSIRTASSLYQIQVDQLGYLRHVYYGKDLGEENLTYINHSYDIGFSGNPYEWRVERIDSPDVIPQEYPSYGSGDYRITAAYVRNQDGSRCAQFRYSCHEITKGKYTLNGLPASYDEDDDCETLTIHLEDSVSGLTLLLYYGVFAKRNIITRAAEFKNTGTTPVTLEQAGSACLDLPYGNWDLIHFHGRHLLERQPERIAVPHLVTDIGSNRGMSSHQHNPFVILADHEATEDRGNCYGMMFMYSGSFLAQVERDQTDAVRVVMGIHPSDFCWTLNQSETFVTPEVILTWAEGLTALSHNYHDFIRQNVTRGDYQFSHRPVLINSWEANYFDIEKDRVMRLAEEAAALGIEMFVLDDGWFKGRNDDNAGLGDWFENTEKLPEGLGALIQGINQAGLKFGIWIEPEMVNEDSDLYRAHPDWAFTIPGRAPIMGRNQLVLDMSRNEVVEYLYRVLFNLLNDHPIDYIKWDMNRCLGNVYSHGLPADRQGEVMHRYVLGVYELIDRLETAFPHVLFEGCAGGGGRFDAGMLYYTPQIWCSDDTDPLERILIQNGTSYGYPPSTMGAHVSASPNHQTGRSTLMRTRAITAMSGAFGYELDLETLTEDEKNEIRADIIQYHADEEVLLNGRFYRLEDVRSGNYAAWMSVSEDRSSAIVSLVMKDIQLCPQFVHISLKGLDEQAQYYIREDDAFHSGAALMHAGYTFQLLMGDYRAVQLHLTRK